MAIQGGEASGLGTASQYAAGMSAATCGQAQQTATFIATLQAAGVQGEVLGAAQAAQQASESAGAAWKRAHDELTSHQQVGAAYAAHPGAGTKEFVMGDTTPPDGVSGTGDQPANHSAAPATEPPAAGRRRGPTDPLRVGDRIVLGDGEQFVASGAAKDGDGTMVLAAAVDTPTGRVVHVGVPVIDEDKKNWKGANAPNTEQVPDEEFPDDPDEAQTVDTWSDSTVVVEARDAAALPDQVEDVIRQASAVDKEYRQVTQSHDRLYEERSRLEAERFDSPDDADRKIRLDGREEHHEKYQKVRRDHLDACRDRLGADDRARYDDLQRRIDEAGQDAFEAGKEDHAAAVSGLTVEEYRELYDLTKVPYTERTREQARRVDELERHGHKPPLLAEQAAIVYGLSLEEYREMEALEQLGRPQPYRQQGRTAEQQARWEQLRSAPGGANFATADKTGKMRGRYECYQDAHHSDKMDWAQDRESMGEVEARARPLDAASAARLAQVTAELAEVGARVDELAGEVTAAVQVPGRNGATLVIEAVQRDEVGGVDYKVDCMPAGASEDWSSGDAYQTSAGGLRKVAKLAAGLAEEPAARPAVAQAFQPLVVDPARGHEPGGHADEARPAPGRHRR